MINDETDKEGLHSLSYDNQIDQNRVMYFGKKSFDINACYERSFVNKPFAPSIQVPGCSLPNQSSK